MANRIINNVKLGAFVIAGLLFLVLLLYMIGKNRNLFGDTYILKARFENVNGLVPGNNVRFSGIEAGTVKSVKIFSDTVIEVSMIIDKKMLGIIHKNAIVSIGTDGLVGNKVINIIPVRQPAQLAAENDILASKRAVDTDDMLQTLSKTNNDVAIIASNLKLTVQRINNSSALWELLNDRSIPLGLKTSVKNIRLATVKAGKMVTTLNEITTDLKNGKGSLGTILRDTGIAQKISDAVLKIKSAGDEANSLIMQINKIATEVDHDINTGKGTVNALLKDSLIVVKLNASLDNIQQGTDGFNQNMEALKHNFLLRGYFRKLEKQKQKEEKKKNSKKNN